MNGDFNGLWLPTIENAGMKRVGLHANPLSTGVREFLGFIENNRDTVDLFTNHGISVEYEFHALEYLLPRALFGKKSQLFREDSRGERSSDFNCCPSSSEALAIIEENSEKLARTLKQTSHDYYFWADDDMGGDVKCCCPKCRKMNATEQNSILYSAILRGIKKYDDKACISLLIYGKEQFSLQLPKDMFMLFAPFGRRHDLPITVGEENGFYGRSIEKMVADYGSDSVEVLEYFLSYDFTTFLKQSERVEKDLEYYRKIGVNRLATFVVFPNKISVEDCISGLEKYVSL